MAQRTSPPADNLPDHDWTLEVPIPVEPGVYPATLTSVTLRVADDGRSWLAWEWTLEDGRVVGGGTSYALGIRTKAYAWVSALLGRDRLGGGVQVTESDLLGAPCQVVVELDLEGQGKVSSVLPPAPDA